ncbi:hypothetical protein HY449_03470 [Candidatus Pacearchaeota archaeon]|nr:hypothetical protein [Candidatus Pacearchaeota archaeon]
MIGINEIRDSYDVSSVGEIYDRNVEITDLQENLGTKGHLLIVRGDKAYAESLGNDKDLANPKFWLYENLIKSLRIEEQLALNPSHRLFDGVGFSALEALAFHSQNIGRPAVVVMANEMVPDADFYQRFPNVEVIHASGIMEEGYLKKQAEILASRDDLIPLHQALYGARGLAPVGNKIVAKLEEIDLIPDETFWCIASGSNLYGIGHKIKAKFPNSRINVVEPTINNTVPPSLDLSNHSEVKRFAQNKLRNYSLEKWDKRYSGIFPLHVSRANRYLLILWAKTGEIGFDATFQVPAKESERVRQMLKEINPEFDWTKTTSLSLVPAIESAKQGKNVLIMAYGKNREHMFRNLIVNEKR